MCLNIVVFVSSVRDTFCSYGVMDLCTKGLGTSIVTLQTRGINLSCVRTLCVIAEERPRIQLTTSFTKLFSGLGLSARAVSTSFGCRVNVGISLQVGPGCHTVWSLVWFCVALLKSTVKLSEGVVNTLI